MNLLELRTEVLNRGFDPTLYSSRIDQFINDGLKLIARRVDYNVDDAAYAFQTASSTATYALPADIGRARSLFDSDRNIEMTYCSIRDIDRSPVSNGAPAFYALNNSNIVLYPIPDNVYNLTLRYWSMPASLLTDNDEPNIPEDWHWLLWTYAVWKCFEAEDDPQTGGYWSTQFATGLAEFAADQKFPSTDGPSQIRSMWDMDMGLSSGYWGPLWGW